MHKDLLSHVSWKGQKKPLATRAESLQLHSTESLGSSRTLVQDSTEFVRRTEAREFVVPPGYQLYSGDIKQCFLSCRHDGLLEAQPQLLNRRRYPQDALRAFVQLAHILLGAQYSYAPEVPGVFNRVLGATMGASQASEVCDVYVALNHDEVFVGNGRTIDVAWYVRFRDDC